MLIETTKGMIEEALLEKRTGENDNERDCTMWVEYWLKGELVHRSASVRLKNNVFVQGVEGVQGKSV